MDRLVDLEVRLDRQVGQLLKIAEHRIHPRVVDGLVVV
jgi:hypothetical protein